MTWQARLRREATHADFGDFALLYHAGLQPIVPPEYDLPGIVGLTFRLHPRRGGGHVYVTTLDLGAAVRVGDRIGLDPGAAVAMVDSHERVHVAMQLAGVDEATEEEQSRIVDAVWLSFHDESFTQHLTMGQLGLVTRVGTGFRQALLDRTGAERAP